jgi:hypothetical protein
MKKDYNEWIEIILSYLNGIANINELEKWVYNSTDTEDVLGKDGYFDYFDFDFIIKYQKTELGNILKDALTKICSGDYRKVEVKWITRKILNGGLHIARGSGMLSYLRAQGYDFIPKIFSDYCCDLGPFADERYSQQIIEECNRIVNKQF